MSIAWVSRAGTSTNVSSTSLSISGYSVTQNNALVVTLATNNSSAVGAVSDSANNTWVKIGQIYFPTSLSLEGWAAIAKSTIATDTITVTWNNNATAANIGVDQYSGVANVLTANSVATSGSSNSAAATINIQQSSGSWAVGGYAWLVDTAATFSSITNGLNRFVNQTSTSATGIVNVGLDSNASLSPGNATITVGMANSTQWTAMLSEMVAGTPTGSIGGGGSGSGGTGSTGGGPVNVFIRSQYLGGM